MNLFYIRHLSYFCLLNVLLSGPIFLTSYHKVGQACGLFLNMFHDFFLINLFFMKLFFMNLFSWTSDTTAMFAFYLCVHHKCANCPNLISLAFYFHELVQHKLSFMIFFLHQTPPLCLPLICVLKWTNCPKLISQRCQACCLLFSWTCSN